MTPRRTRATLVHIASGLIAGWFVAGSFVAGAAREAAAQAIAAPLLAELKAATVYVKVVRRSQSRTGSGFVVQNNKGGALIVTSAHVLFPPLASDAEVAKNVSKETARLIHERQKALSHIEPTIAVVLNSGTPQERTLRADVLGSDSLYDLAVLRVAGMPETVKPIRLNREKIPETTTLIGLGFPFGGQMAQPRTNPTITVTRVELSSYKPAANGTTLMQLQGPLNPGNSGGPVVDTQGKLCGVEAMTIVNSGFGFAIPTDVVMRTLQGRMTIWEMGVKRTAQGQYDVEYRVRLIDPLRRLGDLKLNYASGAVTPAAAGTGAAPGTLAGGRSIALKRDGDWASGRFTLSLKGPGPLVVTVEPTWTVGKKKGLARPEVARIAVSQDAPAGPDDGRTVWRFVDSQTGEGTFLITATGWEFRANGDSRHFVEVGRTPEMIELADATPGIRVRLYHDKTMLYQAAEKKWGLLHSGAWGAMGTVAEPND